LIVIICQMTTEDFPRWLNDQLKAEGLRPVDLAKVCQIDNGVISRLLSGERRPTPETLSAIARGLRLPPEYVFRVAGLLPNNVVNDRASRLAHRIAQLPDEDQEILDAMIDGLFLKRGKKSEPTDLPQDGTAKAT
jgi:transcriptional regulator with XRE-family HTH domain